MDLLEYLLLEVEAVREFLGVEPARPLPSSIEVVEKPISIHSTSSLRGRILKISAELIKLGRRALKKEALSLFIPPEADSVPQVHDIAWVYSGLPRELWMTASKPPPRHFSNYDPYYLFSHLRRAARERAIRDILLAVRAAAERGWLDFPSYVAILYRVTSRSFRLTDSDRRILRALSRDPYASAKEIGRAAEVSEATVSRSTRKLRRLGLLFGPENVNIWKLNLTALVASYPNVRRYREAFWEFPFTYTQFVPVSGSGDVHAYLVVPSDAAGHLAELSDFGVEVGVAKAAVQKFNLDPPTNAFSAMVRAYQRSAPAALPSSVEASRPPLRLSRTDLRILNHVLREGQATESALKRMGIKSAKLRLSRLRRADLIRRYYMLGHPAGHETVLIRVFAPLEELSRLVETLASAATTIGHYVEGRGSYCLAVATVRGDLESDLVRGVRAIYGDSLELATGVLTANPLWLLPVELWDEEEQRFDYRGAVEDLKRRLSD